MERQWRIRRQLLALPDGQRRWDRAYQQLLSGTPSDPPPPASEPPGGQQRAEAEYAGSSLRTGFNTTASTGADH